MNRLRFATRLPLALAFVWTDAYAQSAQPIARATFLANMDAEFRKIDTNHDGHVDRGEAEAYQLAMAQADALRRAEHAFSALDRDHDSRLTFDEFKVLFNPPAGAVNGLAFIGRMDTDHDRRISLIEYRTATLANFDRLDTDKDGIVTPAEMAAGGIKP